MCRLRETLFRVMGGSPASGKGHARRLLTAYLALLDRELRLAEAIGFGRQEPRASALARFSASEIRSIRDALKEPLYDPDDPALTPPSEFIEGMPPKS
jgi:hypothetical protein